MATDLYPTKTRLALLRDVEVGEVWQNSGNGHSTTPGTIGDDTEPLVVVTSRIAEQEQAGWVHLFEHTTGAKQWQLTDAGREVLAANDQTEG